MNSILTDKIVNGLRNGKNLREENTYLIRVSLGRNLRRNQNVREIVKKKRNRPIGRPPDPNPG